MTINRERIVTTAQMRDLEYYAINKMGMPGILLMERAALACTERLCKGDFDLKFCICLCGTGNNGGDGMAVARLLYLAGYNVCIILVGDFDRLSMDATQQLAIAENYGVPVIHYYSGLLSRLQPTVIVDAIFGIGLSRPVEGTQLLAIEEANSLAKADCKILSIDIPSGISTDTGEALGAAVNANATVTFAFNKLGLTQSTGKLAAGELTVADIGIYDFDDKNSGNPELSPAEKASLKEFTDGIAPIADHLNGLAVSIVTEYQPIVKAIAQGTIDDHDEIDRILDWLVEYAYNEQMRFLLLTACRAIVQKYPDIVASHLQSYHELYG